MSIIELNQDVFSKISGGTDDSCLTKDYETCKNLLLNKKVNDPCYDSCLEKIIKKSDNEDRLKLDLRRCLNQLNMFYASNSET
jgi:hypothetical protein